MQASYVVDDAVRDVVGCESRMALRAVAPLNEAPGRAPPAVLAVRSLRMLWPPSQRTAWPARLVMRPHDSVRRSVGRRASVVGARPPRSSSVTRSACGRDLAERELGAQRGARQLTAIRLVSRSPRKRRTGLAQITKEWNHLTKGGITSFRSRRVRQKRQPAPRIHGHLQRQARCASGQNLGTNLSAPVRN